MKLKPNYVLKTTKGGIVAGARTYKGACYEKSRIARIYQPYVKIVKTK